MSPVERKPVLVVGADAARAESIAADVRGLGRVAVWVDASQTALEMLQVVDFSVVIVNVDGRRDWLTCWEVAGTAVCPVAVVTDFLARDRRYREWAFRTGVTAYLCRPCTRTRLREMLQRLGSRERRVEMIEGAEYCDG